MGRSHPHHIFRFLSGQSRQGIVADLIHDIFRFPNAQSTHGVPGKIDVRQLVDGQSPEIRVHAALDNTEQGAGRPGSFLPSVFTSLRPEGGSFQRALGIRSV